ncbi:MAG TPA: diguanylate cyclase, partial [Candidatus Omnitrophica bacterium]|nr:diguanylate cyclase [Candidatus Omnitrophota bacterium]
YLRFRRKSIGFSVSLGVAIFPEDARDFLSLMEVADSLLYKAKREGKNKVCFTY